MFPTATNQFFADREWDRSFDPTGVLLFTDFGAHLYTDDGKHLYTS